MAKLEEIHEIVLTPMRSMFGKPHGVESADEAISHYADTLSRFHVQDLRDGWDAFLADGKDRSTWPSVKTLMRFCYAARNARMAEQGKEELPHEKERRLHKEANDLLNTDLADEWIDLGIAGQVWRYYQTNERIPDEAAIRQMVETRVESDAWVDAQTNPRMKRILQEVHQHEIKRLERARNGGPYIPLGGDRMFSEAVFHLREHE